MADKFAPEVPMPIFAAQWEARAHELLTENMQLRTVVEHQRQQLDALRDGAALAVAQQELPQPSRPAPAD